MAMTLEPCPFCGAPGEVSHNAGYGWWQAGCTVCGCKISEVECHSEADAVVAWNTRTHVTKPAQTVDVGAIREVIAELDCVGSAGGDHYSAERLSDAINDASDKLTRALTAAPPPSSPTTGAIGENGK